jgi:hypothetical protein
MTMAHIQQFLNRVQVAQQTNTPKIVLTLNQAQDLAVDIGQVLAVAFAETAAAPAPESVVLVGGSFTDK